MGKYKVCVYAICKNEEKFVNRWMDSMNEADLVIVADTGSTDKSIKKLTKKGAIVHSIEVNPWRFDVARNMSLDLVPDDVDICVCTDLDEYFEKGWRNLLEKAWKENTTRLKYSYTWNFNEDGTPGVTFLYEKIHKRQGFKWVHPVHEILEYTGDAPDSYSFCYDIKLYHRADPSKSRSNYLPLLELSVEEDPTDDRNMHYLGREYMFYGRYDEAIITLRRHLNLERATWNDERCASMRYISRCYKAKNDLYNAKIWLYKAIAESPYLREPYVEMAKVAYLENNYPLLYSMVNETLNIKEKPLSYINEPFCWDYTIYDLGAISAYNLGIKEKALEFSKIAYEMSPNIKRLKSNYDIIKKEIEHKQ